MSVVSLILSGIACILLFTWILKLLAICNAIRWLGSDGRLYRELVEKQHPTSQDGYDKAIEECNGKKSPFGIKDYRLRKFSKRVDGYKALTYLARFYQAWLFRFNRLIGVTSIYLFITSWLIPTKQVAGSSCTNCYSSYLYWLAVISLGANFLLSIEALYSYAILGSYAVSYHMQAPKEKGLSNELELFVFRVFTTILAGATAVHVAYIKCNAISGKITSYQLSGSASNLWNCVIIYLQCAYFTVTTFTTVGYGDILPENGAGQLLAFFVEIQSVSLIAIVFASLLASRSRD